VKYELITGRREVRAPDLDIKPTFPAAPAKKGWNGWVRPFLNPLPISMTFNWFCELVLTL
jgi:hypothetical protein